MILDRRLRLRRIRINIRVSASTPYIRGRRRLLEPRTYGFADIFTHAASMSGAAVRPVEHRAGAPYASGWKPYGTELYWHDFRWPALPDRSRLLQPSLALHLTLNASTQIQEPAEAVACVPVTSISKVCAPKLKPVIE